MKLNRLLLRHRSRQIIAVLFGVLVVGALLGHFLDTWTSGPPQIATVVGYPTIPPNKYTGGEGARVIIQIGNGSEGLMVPPFPSTLLIGQKILVREEISTIYGLRRFRFAGWPNSDTRRGRQ